MDREFSILNKEFEIGLLDTEYNRLLSSDNIDLDKLRELVNQTDDAYDELLDLYQEQLNELLTDVDIDPEEASIIANATVNRMMEICAIMFE